MLIKKCQPNGGSRGKLKRDHHNHLASTFGDLECFIAVHSYQKTKWLFHPGSQIAAFAKNMITIIKQSWPWGLIVSSIFHDSEQITSLPFAGQINPHWTERKEVEIDPEAKSTIWNYPPLWFCNCIINVKRKSSYWDEMSFPFSDWWYDRGNTVGSLSSALYPSNLCELFPPSQGECRGKHIKQDYTYRARVYLLPLETYLICLLPW